MKWLMSIHRVDCLAFGWCMSRASQTTWTQLSRMLSRTADGPLYVVVLGLLWIWHPVFDNTWLTAALVAVAVERSLYFVLKNSFRRNRPQDAIAGFRSFIRPSDQFSFPSGHTSGAFLFAVFMAQLLPALTPILMLWAASIGFSRVFLGVHFPTDTLMGALLGSTVASLTLSRMVL